MKNSAPSGGGFDLESITLRLQEIDIQLSKPDAWNNPELLTPVLQEKSQLESERERFAALQTARDNVEEWLFLAEDESEEDILNHLSEAITLFQALLEKAEMDLLLSEKEDKIPAILEIHPGAGGTEAQDWAEMLYRMYTRWGEAHGATVEILDFLNGEEAGIKNVTLRIDCPNAYGLLRNEAGIHRLIRISPFDSTGRRHTSFASVDVLPDANEDITITVLESDLRVDVYRASGAGGQHVNKTNSAVRLTHIPTGIVVQCQNEKSQHFNRETALRILKARLYEMEINKAADAKKASYNDKEAINFGSQVRTYTLQPYRLIKDHRTGTEQSDVYGVLDGNIDKFIHDLLLYRHGK